jgi:tetratricopeptide (TPR) repeat protein
MNEVSWTIVKSSSRKPEQYQRALELAIRVNELEPDQGHQLNTLGVAHFRNEKWTDAIAALKRSEELSSNRLTFHNSYFLAMCSWQLGDHQAALEWYEKAAAWKTADPAAVTQFETELQEFHKEAASLLKKP